MTEFHILPRLFLCVVIFTGITDAPKATTQCALCMMKNNINSFLGTLKLPASLASMFNLLIDEDDDSIDTEFKMMRIRGDEQRKNQIVANVTTLTPAHNSLSHVSIN